MAAAKKKAVVRKKARPRPRRELGKRTAPAKLTAEQVADAIAPDVERLVELKAQRSDLDDSIKTIESDIKGVFTKAGLKDTTVDLPDVTVKVQEVQGNTYSLDEKSLKKRLGAKLWKQVTTVVLDRNKLDAAIKAGEVDETLVAQCTITTPKKPYLRMDIKGKSKKGRP